MKIALLGPSPNKTKYTTKRLFEEAKKVFKTVHHIPVIDVELKVNGGLDAVWSKGSLCDYDYILPRIDSKRAITGYPVIRFLDVMEVKKPYMAETILVAHNKFLTLERLVENNLPVPKTYLTGSKASAKAILEKQKFPIIIKMLSGFGGMGVMFIESKDAATSTIETMKTLKQEICLEEFIPNLGEDIRGIVAGDEIIASFKRIAAPEEKRANLYTGGRAEAFELTDEMKEIAIKSARAIKSDICAVDMIQGKDSMYAIEVNINPGLEGIEKATGINVAQRIIAFIEGQLKR